MTMHMCDDDGDDDYDDGTMEAVGSELKNAAQRAREKTNKQTKEGTCQRRNILLNHATYTVCVYGCIVCVLCVCVVYLEVLRVCDSHHRCDDEYACDQPQLRHLRSMCGVCGVRLSVSVLVGAVSNYGAKVDQHNRECS